MKSVKCPTCGQPAVYNIENRFRPFCSERCQTLDLGAWADERFRVPTDENENAVNENSASIESDNDNFPQKH